MKSTSIIPNVRYAKWLLSNTFMPSDLMPNNVMTNVRLLKNIFELNFGSAQKKIGSHQCSVLNESGTFDIRSFWYNQNTKFFLCQTAIMPPIIMPFVLYAKWQTRSKLCNGWFIFLELACCFISVSIWNKIRTIHSGIPPAEMPFGISRGVSSAILPTG